MIPLIITITVSLLVIGTLFAVALLPRNKQDQGKSVRCSTCQRIVQSGTEPSQWVVKCGVCTSLED
jgi:hypothetical protein